MKLNNKYFLLRHGQTIYQKENRRINYLPNENPFITLTDEGKETVKTVAETLKNCNINLIFSSPFKRTKETAEIVANSLKIKKIIYDEKLVDINLGIFMGKPTDESHKFYFFGQNPFKNRPEGGESWGDILKRVKSFLIEVNQKYKDKNILIVSHADPIWLMAGYLRGYKNEQEYIDARKDRGNSYPHLAQLILA